jgi:hypothetical protein
MREQTMTSSKKSGFLAYIDLLGFSERITSGQFGQFFENYSEALSKATSFSGMGYLAIEKLPYVVFSDSIVIYAGQEVGRETKGDPGSLLTSEEQLLAAITISCARLFEQLALLSQPFKGCISGGEFECHQDSGAGVLIAGRPLVEAYHYEQKQDWIGIMFSPRLVDEQGHFLRTMPTLIHCQTPSEYNKLSLYFPLPFLIQKCLTIPF